MQTERLGSGQPENSLPFESIGRFSKEAVLVLSTTSMVSVACGLSPLTLRSLGFSFGVGVTSALFGGAVISPVFFGGIRDEALRKNLSLITSGVLGVAGLSSGLVFGPGFSQALIAGEVVLSFTTGIIALGLKLGEQ